MLASNASAKCLTGPGWRAVAAHRGCLAASEPALRLAVFQQCLRGKRIGVVYVRAHCGILPYVRRNNAPITPRSLHSRADGWRASSTNSSGIIKNDDKTSVSVYSSALSSSEDSDEILASVSRRAKQIMERVLVSMTTKNSKSLKATTPTSSAKEAIRAADELLELISISSLAEALARPEKNDDDEIFPESSAINSDAKHLHCALISIASRLCSFDKIVNEDGPGECEDIKEEGERLVSLAMDLAHRSSELGLPLHRPLYTDIAHLAASRSRRPVAGTEGAVATRILDAASVARASLHPDDPVPSSFFSPALVALVRRGLLRDAIEVLELMYTPEAGMLDVELDAGMDMLSTLADELLVVGKLAMPSIKRQHAEAKRGVEECVRNGDMDRAAEIKRTTLMPLREVLEQRCDRSADAMELALILRGPVLKQLSRGSTYRLGHIMSVMSSINSSLDGEGEDSDGFDSDMEAEDITAALSSLCDAVDALCSGIDQTSVEESKVPADGGSDSDDEVYENISPEAKAAIKRLRSVEQELDAPPPIIEVELQGQADHESGEGRGNMSPSLMERMAEGMVYIRNDKEWDFPDLVNDLRQWNSGQSIKYTREYERHLFDQMFQEDEDYDDVDEEAGF